MPQTPERYLPVALRINPLYGLSTPPLAAGARLTAAVYEISAEGVLVIGNVQGENARRVEVTDGSRVGGSVQVVQGQAATVSDSKIDSDILYDSNDGRLVVLRNRVGGNVQAFQNTGGVTIRRNIIDGNLQCKENTPAPEGGRNVVQGSKEDQCAKL
jgi:hypothetical protein